MRRSLTVFTLILALAVGCGKNSESSIDKVIASGKIEDIHAKKKELVSQQKAIENDIAMLDKVISEKEGNKKLPLVTVFTVDPQQFDHYIELQGDVSTKQNVLVYPEMPGTLLNVYVKEGQHVNKGQLLATIDNGGMNSQLEQLKTQLTLSKTTYERQKRLWEQKIGTEIQYLQAKTNYEAQENAVNQMQRQLDKFKITAPFTGIIDNVIKSQGTVVAPGGPGSEVFRIVNLSDMYVEVSVPEIYISDVTVGKSVKIFFPVLNETIESKVRQAGNFIDPNNRSFTIEVAVPNNRGRIKPNLTAIVKINDYKNDKALLIPQSVISENAEGEQYAYVATEVSKENEALAKRSILKTGKTQGDFVEIVEGLNPGDKIIKEGARSVKDGQQIKILIK